MHVSLNLSALGRVPEPARCSQASDPWQLERGLQPWNANPNSPAKPELVLLLLVVVLVIIAVIVVIVVLE